MARKQQQPSPSRFVTSIIGGALLVFCFIWLGWIVFHPKTGAMNVSPLALPRLAPPAPTATQIPALLAQGITLSQTDQKPALSQQQALLIANQLEPEAASNAKKVGTYYALLNYPVTKTPATHPALNNVPVWLIEYQQIPLPAADAGPAASVRTSHDLYVFLDANSGKELLALWA